jgi:putative flippase GtrA
MDTRYRKPRAGLRQAIAFLIVGCAALATHLSVVALLVELGLAHALTANVCGFLVAFLVSFNGHARFTFAIEQEKRNASRVRFFAVAVLGFVLNQVLYAEALKLTFGHYYLVTLALILLAVAAVTFTLSKLWAFASDNADVGHLPGAAR